MRIANRCHIAGWVVSAGSLALLAGCSWPFPSPFATRATVEDYVPQQTIHVPCPAMSIPEALDLAHRQCGLEWSAVAGAIDPADPAPVGPFQMDSDVPLSVLLDRVARAAGSGWQWKHRKAVFGEEDPESVQLARYKLLSKSADERLAGVGELAELRCPSCVIPLAAACRDKDSPSVRRAAFAALAAMEADVLRYQPPGRIGLLAAMLEDPPDLVLPDEPPGEVSIGPGGDRTIGQNWRNAVIVLGAGRVADAEPAIRRTMDRANDQGLAVAAWALGQFASGDSVEKLAAILRDARLSESVRWQAGLALARQPETVHRTAGMVPVRQAAGLEALVALAASEVSEGGEGSEGRAARAASQSTRLLAVESLGWSQSDQAVGRLARLAAGEPDQIALAAADALARIGSEAACKALGELLISKSPAARRWSADALGQTGSATCRELLSQPVPGADARLRAVMADALGRLGGTSGGEALLKLSADPSRPVRLAALTGLARLDATRWPGVLDTLRDRKAGVDEKLAVVIGLGLSRDARVRRHVRWLAQIGGDHELVRQARLAMIRTGAGGDVEPGQPASQPDVAASRPDVVASQPAPDLPPSPAIDLAALDENDKPTVEVHSRPDGTVLLYWSAALAPPGGAEGDLAGAAYLIFRVDDAGGTGGGVMMRLEAWPVAGNAWIDRAIDSAARPAGSPRRYVVVKRAQDH